MPTLKEVLSEIEARATESTKKTMLNHGAKGPIFGTKIEELKKILKTIKKDQELALQLYDSGISDAMYLAGLAADGGKMTRKQLNDWAKKATWHMIGEYTVPWVASENPEGFELGLEWIDSKNELIMSCGWATLSAWVSVTPDEQLDMKQLKALMKRVAKEIHTAPNRVRYTMNTFIISVAGYVPALTDEAIATAEKIGTVYVDMGGTACKVPEAIGYIDKMKQRNIIGRKKKTAKC